MVEFTYTLTGDEGLHARPAGNFVKKVQTYPQKITVTKGGKSVDAKRLFSVINLQINKGDAITVAVEGEGEADAARELQAFCAETL